MFRKAVAFILIGIDLVLLLGCFSCSSIQVHQRLDMELYNRVENLLSCCSFEEYAKVAQDLWELGPPAIPILEEFLQRNMTDKYPPSLCKNVLLAFKYGFSPNAFDAYKPGQIHSWEYPVPHCDLEFSKKIENLTQEKDLYILVELLRRSSSDQAKVLVVLDALESLGNDAIPSLIDALVATKRNEKLYRFLIGVALRRTGPAGVAALLDALKKSTTAIEKYCLLEGIGIAADRNAGAQIEDLLEYSEEFEFSIVSGLIPGETARALGVIGYDNAVVRICSVTNVTDEASWRFIVALGQLRSPKAIPKLSSILNTNNYQYLRERAARALGSIGTKKAVNVLEQALQNEKEEKVVRKIILALGAVRSRSAQEALIRFMKEGRSNPLLVLWDLGKAFARIGESSARPLIEVVLANTSKDNIRVLHYFIVLLWCRTGIYSFAVQELWTAHRRERTLFLDLIAGTDRFALRLLIAALNDPVPEVRRKSKSILLEMTDHETLPFDYEKASPEDWLGWWKENCRYLVAVNDDDIEEMTRYAVDYDAKKSGNPVHWDGTMLSGKHLAQFEEDIKRIDEFARQMKKLHEEHEEVWKKLDDSRKEKEQKK